MSEIKYSGVFQGTGETGEGSMGTVHMLCVLVEVLGSRGRLNEVHDQAISEVSHGLISVPWMNVQRSLRRVGFKLIEGLC